MFFSFKDYQSLSRQEWIPFQAGVLTRNTPAPDRPFFLAHPYLHLYSVCPPFEDKPAREWKSQGEQNVHA